MNMKALVLCAVIPVCLLMAAETPKKDKAVSVPAGAVQVDEYTSRHTDAQGRTWLYRKTPFGLVKMEEKSETADKAGVRQTPFGQVKTTAAPVEKLDQAMIDSTKVRESGDTLLFERPGPFGAIRWQGKKGALNANEQAIWERASKTADSAGVEKARE
jgi:hypothetical protein